MKTINVVTTLSNTTPGAVVNRSVRNFPFVVTNGETVLLTNRTENVTVTATVTKAESTQEDTYSVFSVVS